MRARAGRAIREESQKIEEHEMVEYMMEECQNEVKAYAMENGIEEFQAAEEMVEGYVMTGTTEKIEAGARKRKQVLDNIDDSPSPFMEAISKERYPNPVTKIMQRSGIGKSDEPMFWQSVDELVSEKRSRAQWCVPADEAAMPKPPRSAGRDNTKDVSTLVAKGGTGALSSVPSTTWKEIEVTVDSGACDTVLPTDECNGITIQESAQSKQGMEYEVANGETIPNLGERRCIMMTEGSQIPKRIAFQVADVHKPLLSVTRAADMGYQCVLGRNGGWLQDSQSSERIPIRRKGNLYVMKVWVREAPFSRPR